MAYPTSANLSQFGFQPQMPMMDLSAFSDPAAYSQPQGAPAMKTDMWGATGGFTPPAAESFNFGAQGQQGAMPAPQGFMGKAGSWLSNGQNLGALTQGISALGSAWLGFQQLKQQNAALGFQKQAFQANLRNSTQAYNTSLEDRIRGRSANPDEGTVQSYLSRHSLQKP